MECELTGSAWLKREFRIVISGSEHRLIYNGRESGSEHVYFDGRPVAGGKSVWWFIPSFHFTLDGKDVSVHVSVWPWLAIRSFRIVIDNRILYEE
jgi:hypothetical protein